MHDLRAKIINPNLFRSSLGGRVIYRRRPPRIQNTHAAVRPMKFANPRRLCNPRSSRFEIGKRDILVGRALNLPNVLSTLPRSPIQTRLRYAAVVWFDG